MLVNLLGWNKELILDLYLDVPPAGPPYGGYGWASAHLQTRKSMFGPPAVIEASYPGARLAETITRLKGRVGGGHLWDLVQQRGRWW